MNISVVLSPKKAKLTVNINLLQYVSYDLTGQFYEDDGNKAEMAS